MFFSFNFTLDFPKVFFLRILLRIFLRVLLLILRRICIGTFRVCDVRRKCAQAPVANPILRFMVITEKTIWFWFRRVRSVQGEGAQEPDAN